MSTVTETNVSVDVKPTYDDLFREELQTLQISTDLSERQQNGQRRIRENLAAHLDDYVKALVRYSYRKTPSKKQEEIARMVSRKTGKPVQAIGTRVVNASDFFLMYREEFADAINHDSDTPEEWQFARIVLSMLKKAHIARERVKGDEAKAAWLAFCRQHRIGVSVEPVPSSGSGLAVLIEALNNLKI